MSDLHIAFFWHQHQPYYKDLRTKNYILPWVRLHAIKDYYGIVHSLDWADGARGTINLVPSLVVQIEEYARGEARDLLLAAVETPAEDLTEQDRKYLARMGFVANAATMIAPLSRYDELYKRAESLGSEEAVAKRFSTQDFLDLQVLCTLAWFHRTLLLEHPILSELVRKRRDYTEADKKAMLEVQQEVIASVLPLHKKAMDDGRAEITTTPFYHPILPLLCNMESAREAMPNVQLPQRRFRNVADARKHVRMAVDLYERVFERKPRGMWPAEGSVSEEAVALLAEHGVEWIASDEEILEQSLHTSLRDASDSLHLPTPLYEPHIVETNNGEITMIFRDHVLSDLIGFRYQTMPAEIAAKDFVARLKTIQRKSKKPALIPVILDGENAWQYYPQGGVPFLRALYNEIEKADGLHMTTVGAYLDAHPPQSRLPRLFAGSWIHHNFAIWIGHPEDNAAWDRLYETREFVASHGEDDAEASPELKQAWQEIYIAEGSDWFWWYGEDHSSEFDDVFDALFRTHLQNAYRFLGETPPSNLDDPICRICRRKAYTEPRDLLSVKVDGRVTSYFEWADAGCYEVNRVGGAMQRVASSTITEVRFGFNHFELFVRVDFVEAAADIFEDETVLRLNITRPKVNKAATVVVREGPTIYGFINRVKMSGLRVGLDEVLEIAVPLSALNALPDETLRFFIEMQSEGNPAERVPEHGEISLTVPSADYESVMWHV